MPLYTFLSSISRLFIRHRIQDYCSHSILPEIHWSIITRSRHILYCHYSTTLHNVTKRNHSIKLTSFEMRFDRGFNSFSIPMMLGTLFFVLKTSSYLKEMRLSPLIPL